MDLPVVRKTTQAKYNVIWSLSCTIVEVREYPFLWEAVEQRRTMPRGSLVCTPYVQMNVNKSESYLNTHGTGWCLQAGHHHLRHGGCVITAAMDERRRCGGRARKRRFVGFSRIRQNRDKKPRRA